MDADKKKKTGKKEPEKGKTAPEKKHIPLVPGEGVLPKDIDLNKLLGCG